MSTSRSRTSQAALMLPGVEIEIEEMDERVEIFGFAI